MKAFRVSAFVAAILAIVIIVPAAIVGSIGVYRVLQDALVYQNAVRDARAARDHVLRLQLDEETGIRGFALTRDVTFLEPYDRARAEIGTAFTELDRALDRARLVSGLSISSDARSLNGRWDADVAQPTLHEHAPDETRQRVGKTMVDELRRDLDVLETQIDSAATSASSETLRGVRDAIRVGVGVLVAFALLFLAYVLYSSRLEARVERQRRDREIADRASDLQSIGGAMIQLAWTARSNGVLDWYSPRWSEYTGRDFEDLQVNGWQGSVHPDDLAGALMAWMHAVQNGTLFDAENRLRRADGTYRWHRHRALPIRDANGAILKWFGTSTDVEDVRREIALLEAAYEQEKRVADELQRAFATGPLPQFDTIRFAGVYEPAASEASVGGDWYDAFALPDGCVFVSIGDVSGHGLEAAVGMARARQAIVAAAMMTDDPSDVLTLANRALSLQRDLLATAIVARIDPSRGTVEYAGAGHPPPIFATRGEARMLENGGIPLGVESEASFTTFRVPVTDEAVLIFYTDGVLETQRDVINGERRLLAAASSIVAAPGEAPARTLYDRVFSDIVATDDVAILTVTFAGVLAPVP